MIQSRDRNADYPFEPPRERGTWRSLTLAVIMHGLLLALLLHGIDWQNSTPAGAEAELWTPDETVDQVQPTPTPPPTPQAVTPPPQNDDAEIALQEAKKRQEEAQRQADIAEQERQKLLQKQADDRLQQERAAQAKLDQQKADQQKKLQQAQQQQQQQQVKDQQDKLQLDKDAAKKAAEQAAKAKQAAAAQAKAKLDQARQARLNALKGMAGSNPSGSGLAAAGTGTGSGGNGSAGYADKVRHKVLPNVTFGGSIDSNPETVVTVTCAPDGTVLDAHVSKPSSNPAWDSAVLNAVQVSSPMPRDKDGSAPHNFTITFKPKN